MKTQEMVQRKRGQGVAYQETKSFRPYAQATDQDPDELCLDPLQVSIARLSVEDIRTMSDADLVELANLSGLFAAREWTNYIQFMARDELSQTAFLARRLCRHRVNSVYQRSGRQTPFPDEL